MKKKLLIIGAGFAGRFTYQSLSKELKDLCDVTIVDNNEHFLFTPLLHEVAGSTIDVNDVCQNIHDFIGKETEVVKDTVVSINYQENMVVTESGKELAYDILVLGIGSKTNFFSTEGAQEHSMVLKRASDAVEIDTKVSELLLKNEPFHINIIGGGPTGVELAGELADRIKQKGSITLFNGGENLLNPFKPSSQKYAQKILEKKGVVVRNSMRITELKKDTISSSEGETFPSSLTVWAAGVQPQVVDSPCDPVHVKHRIEVNEYLQIPEYTNVFALGDVALVSSHDERGYPMLAQVAKQQGKQTAKNIQRFLKGKQLKAFEYTSRGTLASLGHGHAIVETPLGNIYGFLGYLLWKGIYLVTFNSMKHRLRLLRSWFV